MTPEWKITLMGTLTLISALVAIVAYYRHRRDIGKSAMIFAIAYGFSWMLMQLTKLMTGE